MGTASFFLMVHSGIIVAAFSQAAPNLRGRPGAEQGISRFHDPAMFQCFHTGTEVGIFYIVLFQIGADSLGAFLEEMSVDFFQNPAVRSRWDGPAEISGIDLSVTSELKSVSLWPCFKNGV